MLSFILLSCILYEELSSYIIKYRVLFYLENIWRKKIILLRAVLTRKINTDSPEKFYTFYLYLQKLNNVIHKKNIL